MRKLISGTATALLLATSSVAATADDAPPSAIHGFGDASVKPDYITPRGLLVTNQGVTTQLLGGLVFLTSAKTSVVAGIWNDINSDPANNAFLPNSKVGAWNEFDYFAGLNYSPTNKLKLGATYVVFTSPPGVFSTEQNIEFSASYDDGGKDKPFSFQPYAKFFWAVAGDSTVVTGKAGDTFDVELGLVPTLTLGKVTLTMPTWITVGPSEYWDDNAAKPSGSNVGVLTTGLSAKTAATFIPPQFGHWYVYGGLQYYNLLNGNLVDANKITTGGTGHRNVVNAQVGTGFGF
jgi:hypothetical protein